MKTNQSSTVISFSDVSKEYSTAHLKNWRDYFAFIAGKKHLKRINALDSITFSVSSGMKIGIVGLNGAGKSTLVKCAIGLLQPSSGEISLFGNDPYRNRAINNKRIGVVFGQRCQLRWDLAAYDSFRLLAKIYDVEDKKWNERVGELSELLELRSIIHQPIRTLSLGQKMRCELATAFLHDPDLIVLDEPTLGLDLIAKEKIQSLLKKTHKNVFLTSHDVSDIESVCDYVLILHKGKIVYHGRKAEMASVLNVKGRAIVHFLNENPVLDAEALRMADIEIVQTSSYQAEFLMNHAKSLPALISSVASKNDIVDLKWIENDLKQVVRQFYGEVTGEMAE